MPGTDITYCIRDCGNMECKRNKKVLQAIKDSGKTFYVSMYSFKECKEYKGAE